MKHIISVLIFCALIASLGCNKDTPGGPGASFVPGDKPKVGTAPDTFLLVPPTMSTRFAQGEAKSLVIGIKRGKNIDEDVALTFGDLPKGVTTDPANPVIKHGDENAKVTISAARNASLGEFTAKVMGRPTKGLDAFSDLRLTVYTN